MRRSLILTVLSVAVAACSGGAGPATTTAEVTITTSTTTTVSSVATTTTVPVPQLRPCPPAPYRLDYLPEGIGADLAVLSVVEPDVWTSRGGTFTTFFGREDGTIAIALVRGTLPAVDWPGEKGVVEVDGTRAAVGPHPDGTWVMGWYNEPAERCDLYTMVFYAPWDPAEIEKVIQGMVRIPG